MNAPVLRQDWEPLRIEAVSFAYRRGAPVVRDLSLAFDEPRTCVLGPNGAGKTTLFGLGTGRLLAAQGAVSCGGLVLSTRTRKKWARIVGWTPQDVPVAPGLTVQQQTEYVAWLHGVSRSRCRDLATSALEAVGLAGLRTRKVSTLSGGQRRRVGIASGIVHRPAVAFLDEPTAGLDAAQRQRFRDVLRSASEHTRLVVSTHQTEDVHELYERVVVIHDGAVAFDGTTADFLDHAPPGVESARRAEQAYVALVSRADLS